MKFGKKRVNFCLFLLFVYIKIGVFVSTLVVRESAPPQNNRPLSWSAVLQPDYSNRSQGQQNKIFGAVKTKIFTKTFAKTKIFAQTFAKKK
jgi:hypothetical protein